MRRVLAAALALGNGGCSLELGGSYSRLLDRDAETALVHANVSLRTGRGNGPFVGAEIAGDAAHSLELRVLAARGGYAWWLYPRRDLQIGVELSLLGGLAAPLASWPRSALDGYVLGAGVAMPIGIHGGRELEGMVVGNVVLTVVPFVDLRTWVGAPSTAAPLTSFEFAGGAAFRVWFRSDLGATNALDHLGRSR